MIPEFTQTEGGYYIAEMYLEPNEAVELPTSTVKPNNVIEVRPETVEKFGLSNPPVLVEVAIPTAELAYQRMRIDR